MIKNSILDTLVQINQLVGTLSICDSKIKYNLVGKVIKEINILNSQTDPRRYNVEASQKQSKELQIALTRAKRGNFSRNDVISV